MAQIDEFLAWLADRLGREPGPADVTDADVSAAEQEIGARLPASYRKLVTSCLWEELPCHINWLGRHLPPGIDLLSVRRSSLAPRFLIPISGDGSGDAFCFDTGRPNPEGEYPIVLWEHEIHDENSTEFRTIAPNLATFLLQAIRP